MEPTVTRVKCLWIVGRERKRLCKDIRSFFSLNRPILRIDGPGPSPHCAKTIGTAFPAVFVSVVPFTCGWRLGTQPHAATWTAKGLEVRSRGKNHCSPQSLEPKSCTPSAPVLQVYKYFFPFQAISHRILFVFSLVYLQRYLGLILATREHKSFKQGCSTLDYNYKNRTVFWISDKRKCWSHWHWMGFCLLLFFMQRVETVSLWSAIWGMFLYVKLNVIQPWHSS